MDNLDEELKNIEVTLEQQGINDEIHEKTEKVEIETSEQKEQERVLTAFEQDQQAKGWNPDGPKSAEEWARAEPLYEELKTRGKEIKSLRRTINELKEHMDKQEQVAYEKAYVELIAQRDQAIMEGNVDLVHQIEQETNQLQQTKPTELHPSVKDFQERNEDWLTATSFEAMEMQRFAYERDQQLASQNLDPNQHMTILEEHIKQKFPKYFNIETTEMVGSGAAVEANTPTTSTKKTYGFKDLSSEQKQVARDFERMGVMKTDEYIKQLIQQGDLQ